MSSWGKSWSSFWGAAWGLVTGRVIRPRVTLQLVLRAEQNDVFIRKQVDDITL